MAEQDKDKGEHYRFTYRGIKLDPARIATIYNFKYPIQIGILKKVLCAGNRGKKGLVEDIEDVICGCKRWIEMLKEDEENGE